MKISFLGTNGWYDTKTGNTTCILIETASEYIILDAGFGFYKIGRHIIDNKPIYLFISHLHLDHIIGLHTLPIFKFDQGIKVYMPPGMKRFIETLIDKPYSKPLATLPTNVELYEIDDKTSFNFDFQFDTLLHPVLCYGFRFKLEGKYIVYCTDTEDCPALRKLAKDADLLIAECSFRPGEETKNSFHLNPEVAATFAKDCNVKKFALMHFDAARYPSLIDRKNALASAQKIFQNTVAPNDGEDIMVAMDPKTGKIKL